MKKIFILLTILFLTNCENSSEEKRSKNFENAYFAFILVDGYHYVNTCPPVSQIYDAGTYDISLKKGEALYYDISARLNPSIDNQSYLYFIGISKNDSANLAINFLGPCLANGTISRPQPLKGAKDQSLPVDSTDSEFSYYRYGLFKTIDGLLTIKAVNSDTNFKLKIPAKGE